MFKKNLHFKGQYLDREKRIYLNTLKIHNLIICKFTQQNPNEVLSKLNLYEYAPKGLTWIDLFGLRYINKD